MNRFTKQFHTTASETRLTHAERRHIYTNVMIAMRENAHAIPSPYATPLFTRLAAAAFLIVLIVGVSGGTAFAAEGALPGDALYAFKVNVNEPIMVALATTPEEKATANAVIANERLSEAQQLAVEGRLTADTSAQLAVSFKAHASAVYAAAARLGTSNPEFANELSANFSNSVAEKGTAILSASIGTTSTTSIRASDDLVLTAVTSGEAADTVSVTSTESPANTADTTTRARHAHQAVSDATSAVTNAHLSGSGAAASKSQAAALANLIVKAHAEAALGSTTQANQDYEKAVTKAATLQTLVHSNASSTNTNPPKSQNILGN